MRCTVSNYAVAWLDAVQMLEPCVMALPTSYSPVQIVLPRLYAAIVLWALISRSLLSVVDSTAAVEKERANFNASLTAVFITLFIVRRYLVITAAVIRHQLAGLSFMGRLWR